MSWAQWVNEAIDEAERHHVSLRGGVPTPGYVKLIASKATPDGDKSVERLLTLLEIDCAQANPLLRHLEIMVRELGQ